MSPTSWARSFDVISHTTKHLQTTNGRGKNPVNANEPDSLIRDWELLPARL